MKKINLSKLKNLSKKEKKIASVILPIIVILFFWFSYNCFFEKVCGVDIVNKLVRHDLTIETPNGAIVAEVADTKSSRELGLSGRSSIRDNEGMIFVFDVPGRYGFWMKDMNFPLDIIWINQNGVVVKIEPDFTPESYKEKPPKVIINGPDASYVLEINAGRAEQYGLFLGSKVKIEE